MEPITITDSEATALRTAHDVLVRIATIAGKRLAPMDAAHNLGTLSLTDWLAQSECWVGIEVDANQAAHRIKGILAVIAEEVVRADLATGETDPQLD